MCTENSGALLKLSSTFIMDKHSGKTAGSNPSRSRKTGRFMIVRTHSLKRPSHWAQQSLKVGSLLSRCFPRIQLGRQILFFFLFFFSPLFLKVTPDGGSRASSSLYFEHRSDQDLKGAPSLPPRSAIKEVQLFLPKSFVRCLVALSMVEKSLCFLTAWPELISLAHIIPTRFGNPYSLVRRKSTKDETMMNKT